ncbi:MAG: nucleoside triphosphate pyrophosphohydrolase [Pseudomonadota bacterium]|nr:nucleoside triphosphate pyrophosphohydrolase [Pseudomonadota bacterium]MEE2749647.1 nucleoside triphosphate pyrophosphohydrolase [Pseudomonadota bacterium]
MAYQIDDLTYVMTRLRNPETGCPWDLKQDFASILPHTLEEAYEVADAIERQDWPHLEEELGDLLFQVIFYGQMGDEKGVFNLHSIIDRLVAKLIRRHPHVFPDGSIHSEREPGKDPDEAWINQRWEEIKAEEQLLKLQQQSQKQPLQLLDEVPGTLPAIARAYKLQKKASSVGFDWPEKSPGVIGKIQEELDEVIAEVEAGNNELLEKEIGDLLFAVVNLARHHKINPDTALRGTNQRFQQRFAYVEQAAQEAGGFEYLSLEEMDAAWQSAKVALNASQDNT